jgi:hypothetical protein
MLKYRTDKIVESSTGIKSVYVHLYDDSNPDRVLQNICVNYESDVKFERELKRKTMKYMDAVTSKVDLEQAIVVSYAKVEADINKDNEVKP